MALVTREDGATVTHKGNPTKKKAISPRSRNKSNLLETQKLKQLDRENEGTEENVHNEGTR